MEAVAHAARLDQRSDPKNPESMTHRAVWQDLADKGDVRALAALEEPPYPHQVEYLREWSNRLFARSGMGMDGIAPLSDTTIVHWRINSGHEPTPEEVDALMLLDAVRRDPSIVKPVATARKSTRTFYDKWPTKKPKAGG